MPKGIALAIGLNSVSPTHYAGWSGELNACEADANDMTGIARSQGFAVTRVLTKAATRARVKAQIAKVAKTLKSGDIFMLSYSGHGGQLPDLNNDEPDGFDETWCLYDGELVDDELYAALAQLAAGVRVLVFSDSCHSGTVVKLAYYGASAGSTITPEGIRYRAMPPGVALRTYRLNKKAYDRILMDKTLKAAKEDVRASVLLVSGCQDSQLSQDGVFNGLFTGTLLRVWKEGAFKGDYQGFHSKIVKLMPPNQTPNLFTAGRPNAAFLAQRPFKI